MSFVNNSSSTGIQFIGSTSEAARIGKPASNPVTPATAPVVPQSTDQIAQSAGHEGQAKPVSFLDGSPKTLQVKQLLAQGKFDDLVPLLNSMNSRELADLHLTTQEINKIADGLGKGSLTASLPLIGSYTTEEQNAVQRLIKASNHLSVNQKVYLLKENIGPGAVLEYIQSARPADLKQLSVANRQMALSVLDPGSSIWGTVSGAATEVVSRRAIGGERIEDRLAGQILKSARNEKELHDLLGQLNQFSRDDATYHYVMSLSPQELNGLSDAMKKELLQHLVDTGVQLPLIHIDLNSIANLDETLNMTFKEHVQAARLLYTALTPQAQQSKEIQTIVSKSDALMQELSQLESAIKKDQAAGKLTQEKIQQYRQQAQSLQSKYPDNPQIKQKVQELLGTLTQLQAGLQQAAGSQVSVLKDLEQIRGSIKQYSNALQNSRKTLDQLKTSLPQAQQRLESSEQALLKHYETLIQSRKKFEGLEPRYGQVLQEMEAALQNPRTQKGKLAQLESLNQQLKQIEAQMDRQNQSYQSILAEVNSTGEALQTDITRYNQAAEQVNSRRQELQTQQTKLEHNLSNYQTQVSRLEKGVTQAKDQLQELKQAGAQAGDLASLETEITKIKTEIDAHKKSLASVQTDYTRYLGPEAEKLVQSQNSQSSEFKALEPKIEAAETSQGIIASIAQGIDDGYTYLKEKISQVLDGARSFVSDWQTRLSSGETISSANIQDFRKQLNTQIQELEARRQDSPEEVEAQIQALKALETSVNQLESQLKTSDQVAGELGQSLENLKTRQTQIQQELKATDEVIALSEQALKRNSEKITALQAEISQFQGELGNYSQDIMKLKVQLDARQKESAAAQQNYAEGKISGSDLSQKLKASEAAQISLKQKMESLFQAMQRVQGQMDVSIESLQAQQKSLGHEQTKLQNAIQKSESLRTELTQVKDSNLQKINTAQTTLQNLQSDAAKYPAIQKKAQELQTLVGTLGAKNQEIDSLIAGTNQTLVEVLPLNRALGAAGEKVQTLEAQFQSLKLTQLATTQQSLDHVSREFLKLQETAGSLRKEAEQLEYSLHNSQKPFAIQEMQTQIDQLIQKQGIPSAQVERLLQLKQDLESLRKTRQEGDLALSANRAVRQHHHSDYTAAQAAVSDVRAQVAAIESTLSQTESEVKAGQQDMLKMQQQMLEMRKQLGIHSGAYQERLERYEHLLKNGGNLSEKDVAELQTLEQELSGMEQDLANQSDTVREKLAGFNMLKAKINQQIDSLREKSQTLLTLRQNLSVSLNALKDSRANLATHQVSLQAQRDDLASRLSEIEAMLRTYPGTRELLEIRDQLRQELTETDQLLTQYHAELSQTDQDIHASEKLITGIDETLEKSRTIQEKLTLLILKLNDLIQQGEALEHDLNEMQETLKSQSSDEKATREHLEKGKTLPKPSPAASASPTAKAEKRPSPETSTALKSVQKFFDESLSGLIRQQKRNEEKRENEHQEKREEFIKVLEQQINASRQYDHSWKEKIEQQAELEKITELMIQKSFAGQNMPSGLNILGINTAAQEA
ncbi:hypothetical protein COW36_23935 [bacterium (Candidatus Blackallbacteria) CG17_big_fil_post_rev_8_21_14_2_50_48_46]|uniref:Uncharacterized protein n=1 Tax=bacterium (Candidatus Blackallbacteria) CG17_big_fil_post_rev_8_21_14_2_50_48_46 TaxID=2014261 RepID=A0A2M7FWZ2_9BACT|nr:MAG: hypothetical protein COW64_18875 [bacterium (Candidatus Blackallbacteria) CG18_big_fil_WC_8_21_14_2_50_49_26]PIW13724.1 MAG: hypothetical protein COW36_23935 [bacterium (Candidatus Blackallbacteria) CG17_big_fil_post_rev_8_21_14_2_50_48_46]PIW44950.1 MAG: hypothetical protein COW20_21565 [bacterium (Candidatus Blackallbacteria) CG13_big_fil_rev_8_21_14_2_50_49_14]